MSAIAAAVMLCSFQFVNADVEIALCSWSEVSKEFVAYSKRFPITIEDAQRFVTEHAQASSDEELIESVKFMRLRGIVNGEYIFIPPGTIKKTRIGFFGYHVDARTGKVRYLRKEDMKVEYGGRFPSGYATVEEIKPFLVLPLP